MMYLGTTFLLASSLGKGLCKELRQVLGMSITPHHLRLHQLKHDIIRPDIQSVYNVV